MLLQVTWKVLSSYLLKRVMADVKGYLPKAQTAYQAKKSTDQNIYVLAEAINAALAVAKECTASFVDLVLYSVGLDQSSVLNRGTARMRCNLPEYVFQKNNV